MLYCDGCNYLIKPNNNGSHSRCKKYPYYLVDYVGGYLVRLIKCVEEDGKEVVEDLKKVYNKV